jgi:uncharacterized protein (DUF2249 family)
MSFMDFLDLTLAPIEQKRRLIFDSVSALKAGMSLTIRSQQDLVVVQAHIIEELGDVFLWEHVQSGGFFELAITKL